MRPLSRSASLAFVLLLHTALAIAGDFSGRVVAVTDGDTIKGR
jgi:hypothetical protein